MRIEETLPHDFIIPHIRNLQQFCHDNTKACMIDALQWSMGIYFSKSVEVQFYNS